MKVKKKLFLHNWPCFRYNLSSLSFHQPGPGSISPRLPEQGQNSELAEIRDRDITKVQYSCHAIDDKIIKRVIIITT